MIRFFLQNLIVNNLLLIPYIFLLRIGSFINPPDYSEVADFHFALHSIYQHVHPLILSTVAVILIFIQANLINWTVNECRVNSKSSLVAGFFYILGVSLCEPFLALHPILIANTFLILYLRSLFRTYKSYKPIQSIFMSGFYIGLCILISPSYLLMIPFLIQGMLSMRDVSIKELLQSMGGLLAPIILLSLAGFYFYQESFMAGWSLELGRFRIKEPVSIMQMIGLGIIIFLVFYIVFYQNSIRKKRSVKSQKIMRSLYFLMVYALLMLIFYKSHTIEHVLILAIPLSILYSMYLFTKKRILVPEFMHFFLVIFAIASQFVSI